jgi:predicted hydrocarbon binding protein
MDSSGPTARSPSRPERSPFRTDARPGEKPSVSPVLPLLLLTTMRDRDRPDEILEEEDITLSLPRRLGLSEVVRMQIHRLEEEVKQKRPQVASQVEDLLRLVIRRPDAEEIFADVGRNVARHYWAERAGWMRNLIRALPRTLALLAAQRAGRRMFAQLTGPAAVKLTRKPLALRIEPALTARADPGGAACAFYAGAFAELLQLYTTAPYQVRHPQCACNATDGACEWAAEIES